MRPMVVVVINKFIDQIFQMYFSNDQKMIQAFAFDGCHPAFRVWIKIGRVRRDFHDGNTFVFKESVKFFGIFDVPVSDKCGLALFDIKSRIELFGLFHKPTVIDPACNASQVNLTGFDVDEE